ncbi:MAG TPA: hypothetical protein VLD37_04290 [Candidatus Bilamarchaeum sp.]|nr:hypothetical protein [Candidatus Bilamarchaeum sp.]
MDQRRLLLVLLLAIGTAFAPIEPLDLTFAVPAVIVIVIIFLSLTAMLANTISDPRLEAWYKTELREFVAGVALIVIITAAVISSNGAATALTGTGNYIQASKDVIDGMLAKSDSAFHELIASAGRIRASATYAPYINVPLWYVSISYSTSPLAGIGMILGSLNLGAQALSNAIFLFEGLRLLVIFMGVVAPKILLPLSFIARIIPFTRRVGNTLIAIAVGASVFMPFAIILVDKLNGTISLPTPHVDDIGQLDTFLPSDIVEPLCQTIPLRVILGLTDPLFSLVVCLPLILIPIVGPGLFSACFNLVFYVIYPLINVIFQGVMTVLLIAWEGILEGIGGPEGYAEAVFNQIHPFLTQINNFVLVSYIDFILIVLITVAGARSLSAALGGEWYMAGVQRLI